MAPAAERTRDSVRSWRTRRARAGAECEAQGELFRACGGAGEEEVREVDADDEKDECRRLPRGR